MKTNFFVLICFLVILYCYAEPVNLGNVATTTLTVGGQSVTGDAHAITNIVAGANVTVSTTNKVATIASTASGGGTAMSSAAQMVWISPGTGTGGGWGSTDTAIYRPAVLYTNTASAYLSWTTNAANGLTITALAAGQYNVRAYWEINATRYANIGWLLDGPTGYRTISPYNWTNAICKSFDTGYSGIGGSASCSGTVYAQSNQVFRFGANVSDGTIPGSAMPIQIVVERVSDASGPSAPQNGFLHLKGYTSYGSTDNKIIRFTDVIANQGEGIHWNYTSTAANGSKITILVSGLYFVMFGMDSSNGGASCSGVSVNSTELTTTYYSINATNMFTVPSYAVTSTECIIPTGSIRFLNAGDVVRPHSDGTIPNSPANVHFMFQKIN